MSDLEHIDGEVTIPLRHYMELQARSRELETVKRQLEDEKQTTWKLFGPVFEAPRELHIQEDFATGAQSYVIVVKQPLTKLVVQGYNVNGDWDIVAIYRRLLENHIFDVVKAVDTTRRNHKV